MQLSPLNAILDEEVAARFGWTVPALAEAYLAGGARFLQIRAKRSESGAFLRLCEGVVARAREAGAVVIVNDRADIACLAGASGVHVGQDDLPAASVRAIVGEAAIVGLSTHTAGQVRQACSEAVSYIAIGPVFPTATKEGRHLGVGLEMVREAARLVSAADAGGPARPIVAIGGITLDRAAAVLQAGAASVAVISDLLADGNPGARVAEYLKVLGEGGRRAGLE